MRYESEVRYHKMDCERGRAVCSKSPYTWGLDTAALVFTMFAFLTYCAVAFIKNRRIFRLAHMMAAAWNLLACVFFIACLCTHAKGPEPKHSLP